MSTPLLWKIEFIIGDGKMTLLNKVKKNLLRLLKSGGSKGISLMEIVVVVAVFTTISLVATDLFLTVSRVQSQIGSLQRVQSDVRFATEAMAREVKFGTIDYECYESPSLETCPGLEGSPAFNLSSPVDTLVTRDQENSQVIYRLVDLGDKNELQVCSNTRVDPDRCSTARNNWQNVTPTDVEITSLKFYISPALSPYSDSVKCDQNEDCDKGEISGQCLEDPDSDYKFCYIPNIQPRVTIVMVAESGEGIRKEEVVLQTSVSTMRYFR